MSKLHEAEIKHYLSVFERALESKNTAVMQRAVGVLEYLGVGNTDWLYYWISATQNNYNQALKHLDACVKEEGYNTTINREYAECFSFLGDYYRLAQVFIRMGSELGVNEFVLYMTRVRERISEEEINNQHQRLIEDKIIPDNANYAYPATVKENDKRELSILSIVLQKIAVYVAKGVDLKRKLIVGRYVNHSTYIPEEYEEMARKTVFIVELLPLPGHQRESLKQRCLNLFSMVTEDDIVHESFMYDAADIIYQLLYTNNALNKNYDNFICYLGCIEAIGYYAKLDQGVCLGIHALSDKIGTDSKAKELVYKAFVYENACNSVNFEVKATIDEFIDQDMLEDDIKIQRIKLSCPMQSTVALEAAEWYYDKTRAESYGTLDAGLLSLSYFRIIELEYNIRFIDPFLEKIDMDDVRSAFSKDTEGRSNTKNKSYINRWKKLIDKFEIIKSPTEWKNGLTLGEVRHLLHNLRNSKHGKYYLEDLLFNSAIAVLKSEGVAALKTGEMEDVISDTNIQKYRNPPAHTRYLAYDIACECRKYVLDRLEVINAWFYCVT